MGSTKMAAVAGDRLADWMPSRSALLLRDSSRARRFLRLFQRLRAHVLSVVPPPAPGGSPSYKAS